MIFSLIAVVDHLVGLLSLDGSSARTVRRIVQWLDHWHNDTAAATTTAIAEQPGVRVKQKCRLIGAWFNPAAAVTGTATNFFTLTVDKRTTLVPGTPINLITYAADTVTADDAAAFGSKDLYASPYLVGASADLNLEEGDVLTCEVAKAGTGQTYPISDVHFLFEARD